jgi:hypothetical protein
MGVRVGHVDLALRRRGRLERLGWRTQPAASLVDPALAVGLVGVVRGLLDREVFSQAPLGLGKARRSGLCDRARFLGALGVEAAFGLSAASAPTGSCPRRYSSIARCGSIEMCSTRSRQARSVRRPATSEVPSARETSPRAATSTTIARSPRRYAATPSAAATVDLPTPPLPVTTTSEWSNRGCPSMADPRPAGDSGALRGRGS